MTYTTLVRQVTSACILSLACAAAFASEPATFDRTLPVHGTVVLDIQSDPGGMSVTTGSSDSVVVHAIIKPLYGRLDFNIAEANILTLAKNPPIEQAGNHIRIGYVKNPDELRGVTIHYEIETPRATEVRAHTVSGGISINGIEGPVQATTSSGRTELSNIASAVTVVDQSGSVLIHDAAGAVSVQSGSGGITLAGIQGNVEAATTSGRTEISRVAGDIHSSTHSASIRINDVQGSVVAHNTSGSIEALRIAGAVHAETTSGAISISQTTAAPIRASAGSGSIKVQLAGAAGYSLDAASQSGKIAGAAISGLKQQKNVHRVEGPIRAGGPLVDLDTRSSKIEID